MYNRNNGREIAARLVVLRDYLFANADKTHAVSMEDIQKEYYDAQFMSENGDFVSIKTVYRDLKALEDIWKIRTQYVEKYKGYVLLNPPFEANDLRLIVDSVQASKFITQRKADALTKKITEKCGNGRRHKLNRPAYVYDRIRSQNDDVVKDAGVFYEAIAADRKISFRYFHLRPDRSKEYTNKGKPIIVSPFALYWSDGYLYLYCYNGVKFLTYRVDRMDHITKPLPEKREGAEKYDAEDLTRQKVKVFRMFHGTAHKVKIRFTNNLVDQVVDEFGREIMMIPADADHFTIETPIELSPPFYAWIATFGHAAKIISPPAAVDGMRDFLQKAADMYKDDGNT